MKHTFLIAFLIAAVYCGSVSADVDGCDTTINSLFAQLNDPSISKVIDEVATYDEYLVDISKCMFTAGSNADEVYKKVKSHCMTAYKLETMISTYLLANNMCDKLSEYETKDLGSPILNILAGLTGLAVAVVGFVFPPATIAIVALGILSSTFWSLDGSRNLVNNMSQEDKKMEVVRAMQAVNRNRETISRMTMACEDLTVDKLYDKVDANGDCERYKVRYMDRVCANYYNNGLPPLYFEDCANVETFKDFVKDYNFVQMTGMGKKLAQYVRANAAAQASDLMKKTVEQGNKIRLLPLLKAAIAANDIKIDDDCDNIAMIFEGEKSLVMCDGAVTDNGKNVKVKKPTNKLLCEIPPLISTLEPKKYSLYPSFFLGTAIQNSMKTNFAAMKDGHHKCCEQWDLNAVKSCYETEYRKKTPFSIFSIKSWKVPSFQK